MRCLELNWYFHKQMSLIQIMDITSICFAVRSVHVQCKNTRAVSSGKPQGKDAADSRNERVYMTILCNNNAEKHLCLSFPDTWDHTWLQAFYARAYLHLEPLESPFTNLGSYKMNLLNCKYSHLLNFGKYYCTCIDMIVHR